MNTYFRKSVLGSAIALSLLASGQVLADTTANVGIFSEYIYRGITQTASMPALQGGFDYTNANGAYVGVWGSNINWLADAGVGSSSLELDIYGGYRGTAGAIAYDVGVLQYYYPGDYNPGVVSPDTTEVYGAVTFGVVTGKLSYVISEGLFGVDKASGSYYLDLSASVPVAEGWTAVAHIGMQEFAGDAMAGTDDNSVLSYTDYKLGVAKDLGDGWSASGYYSGTDADDKYWKFPGINGGNNLGEGAVVVGLSRAL